MVTITAGVVVDIDASDVSTSWLDQVFSHWFGKPWISFQTVAEAELIYPGAIVKDSTDLESF